MKSHFLSIAQISKNLTASDFKLKFFCDLVLGKINYHSNLHVFPVVPWHNLQKLHTLVLPEIKKQKTIVDKSHFLSFGMP